LDAVIHESVRSADSRHAFCEGFMLRDGRFSLALCYS